MSQRNCRAKLHASLTTHILEHKAKQALHRGYFRSTWHNDAGLPNEARWNELQKSKRHLLQRGLQSKAQKCNQNGRTFLNRFRLLRIIRVPAFF